MPKQKIKKKSRLDDAVDGLYKKCRYCNCSKPTRRFDLHQVACKLRWKISREQKDLFSLASADPQSQQSNAMPVDVEFQEGCSAVPMELDPLENGSPGGGVEQDLVLQPQLPNEYIKIIPHPHSRDSTAKIIPIATSSTYESNTTPAFQPRPELRPWAPFANLSDFEFTEIAVKGLLSKASVDKLLKHMNDNWASKSNLTLKSHRDMEKVLTRARKRFVQFKQGSVHGIYKGTPVTFIFEYRDPWEWILEVIRDESLAPMSMWNSVQKFYCHGDHEERVYDELNTGETWYDVDSQLPDTDGYPHCYLPLHFWLDKGLVTRRVKKYPMVLRAGWLPREIRNGSGNGGGVLIGYMPVIEDPDDANSRSTAQQEEYLEFKRDIYQKVLSVIFEPLRQRSHNGDANTCGDNITRILYPGIPIESQDAEEAAYFCGCRAASATYPCPKCLASKAQLSNICRNFELRTPNSMQLAVRQASEAKTKAQKELILQKKGLHGVTHFLWGFRFSDPYLAYSYDTLHSDDLGKWGKHLWPLLLQVLEEDGSKGKLTERMAKFPRWRDLKHFNHVSTTHYTDGQAFFDILKCILPCVVDLLPKNSVLVHCIRAYTRYRMLVGLRCMTESRIEHLRKTLTIYQKYCADVCEKYGKNFDFLKQHASHHVIQDIKGKGTTGGYTTRTGEGFQQEAAQAYEQTNMKNAEHQMVKIDEKQEAIARIRMAIDNDHTARLAAAERDSSDLDVSVAAENSHLDPSTKSQMWRFGSPEGKRTTLRILTNEISQNRREYKCLDERLRDFIAYNMPREAMRFEDEIYVQRFKYVELKFQSLEDWTEGRDLLRCNSLFHDRPRFDCVVVNDDSPGMSVARLLDLFRCWLPSGTVLDLALIRGFAESKWKPRTVWDGCRVLDEDGDSSLILVDYLVRGALMCPLCKDIYAFGGFSDTQLADALDAQLFVYGIYLCLFLEAVWLIRRRARVTTNSAIIFAGVTAMFLICSTLVGIDTMRLVKGFVLRVNPLGPSAYFFDNSKWENTTSPMLLSVLIWLGDILVIYRCYLVWMRSIWVIILPIILLLFSIGSNTAIFIWAGDESPRSSLLYSRWMMTVYPISFAQNTITTGLIAFKIWQQHRISSSAGARNASSITLPKVLMIVIESAMIYTLQQLALIILYFLGSNGQYIVCGAIAPSIGMVFVLIAVRVHSSDLGTDGVMAEFFQKFPARDSGT